MTYPPQDPGAGGQPPAQPPAPQAPPPQAPPPQAPPPQQAPPQAPPPPQAAPPGYGGPPTAPPPAYPGYGGHYGPPGAPPPPTNKLGKGKTIGIVVGAVGLLALLGVGAAVAFGGDEGGGGDLPPNAGQPTATPGTPAASPGATAQPSPDATTPAPSGTLSPSPVSTGAPPPPPPPPPTQPPGPPVPSPTDAPDPGGDTAELAGGVVNVPLPAGWDSSVSDDGTQVSMADGTNFVWLGVFNADPSTNAASLIAENREVLVSADNFSGLQFGEVKPVQPFGSIVSMATLPYQGVWTDSQASFEVAGLLWVAVRQDGYVLAIVTESTPPTAWAIENFAAILDGSLNSFAGTG